MFDIHYQVSDDSGCCDEEAYENYVESIWRAFCEAPESEELRKIDPRCGHWAVMLLRYYFDHIGSSIADITAPDVDEVVFDLLPRKVSVEPEAAPEIIRELRAFWAFLGREFELPEARKIQTLLDDDAVLNLKNQLADPRNWGMAKSFIMAGQKAGYDMTTQEGNASFMAAYNASLASRRAPAAPMAATQPSFAAASARRAPSRAGKVGRNDPCPCGSGKKFKKCCYRTA